MKTYLSLIAAVLVTACSSEPIEFELTPEGVKSLSPKIVEVKITPQTDPTQFYVSMEIKKEPFVGGAQDWNSVASEFDHLANQILTKSGVVRVRAEFAVLEPKQIGWAYVDLRTKDLPSDWRELSYLQRFSHVDVTPGTLQARAWLCDFYDQYSSARPRSGAKECD